MNPEDFRKLVSAGLSTDQIALVMEMMERDRKVFADAEEARKEKGRARMAKWRLERHRNVTDTQPNVAEQLTRGPARVEDKTSNLEIEPQKEERKETRESAFDAFWTRYPHKVGKADAAKAFDRATKRVNVIALMAGLDRYVAKTDDRPWCNPSTWLNQDRWTDEPAAPPPQRAGPLVSKINPTLQAAYDLKEKLDAVTPSEIEGHHPPPRFVALSGGRG